MDSIEDDGKPVGIELEDDKPLGGRLEAKSEVVGSGKVSVLELM